MKKSERKAIAEIMDIFKNGLGNNKKWLLESLPRRLNRQRRLYVKWRIDNLRQGKILLRAAEKQVPMPVKIEAKVSNFCKYWYDNGIKYLNLTYTAYCQNCGNKVDLGYKMLDGLGHDKNIKYCSHCGQKLWWPKN